MSRTAGVCLCIMSLYAIIYVPAHIYKIYEPAFLVRLSLDMDSQTLFLESSLPLFLSNNNLM